MRHIIYCVVYYVIRIVIFAYCVTWSSSMSWDQFSLIAYCITTASSSHSLLIASSLFLTRMATAGWSSVNYWLACVRWPRVHAGKNSSSSSIYMTSMVSYIQNRSFLYIRLQFTVSFRYTLYMYLDDICKSTLHLVLLGKWRNCWVILGPWRILRLSLFFEDIIIISNYLLLLLLFI